MTSRVQAIRPEAEVMTRQKLPYFIGISGATVGSRGLSMHIVAIPPGARAEPHRHIGYETGIYVLQGRVLTRWGDALEHEVVSEPGDFLFVPPGVPHEAVNLSDTETARAVIARNDPAEQDKVEPYRIQAGAPAPAAGATGKVTLREVTADTLRSVLRLSVAESQKGFVATNAISIAQAYFAPEAWFRAIYLDDEPVGFVMIEDTSLRTPPPAEPTATLWRLMIDERFQRRGIGREAVLRVIEHVRAKGIFRTLAVSYVPEPGGPEMFYKGMDFQDTGRMDEGEVVLELAL